MNVCRHTYIRVHARTYTYVHVRWELYRMSKWWPRCDVSTFQRGVSVDLSVDMDDAMGSSTDLEGHHNNCYTTQGDQGGIKEQDRLLPIANVGRIMKQILPPNAKISKEAKETMQECVSEFISFVTGEASEKCHKEKRKTVNGDDICWALSTLGFDDYAEPMRRYLQKYREMEGDRAASGSHGGRVNSLDSRDEARGEQLRDQSSVAGQFMFNAMERNDASTSRRIFESTSD